MTDFRFPQMFLGALFLLGITVSAIAQETAESASHIFVKENRFRDARLGKLRNLRDAYHPWIPPTSKSEWVETAEKIRTQLKVSNGLIPAWPKTPLNAVVHGEIHRGDYIVQRVFFESMPGHFVSGNLYRPTKLEDKVPGILSPHGHWADARFSDMGEEAALKGIAEGGEKYMSGGRHHIQARMVHLARMGCIVFHYDMVGYSDSKVIDHRADFADAEAGLWLINTMGLQTWNSIRALDFLTSLPDVDADRIAVTGASGGGTQTFMLAALDERVDVAFPAVMVSTAMQGGCVCENADYLRQGINNVAIAALFAPKPLGMTGANDWTIDIETKGLPELKNVYSLYGQPMNVHAEAHPEFGHNYNYVSRAIMYQWMAEYLHLSEASLEETDFWPIPKEELSVFDETHPLPENSKSPTELRQQMIDYLKQQNTEMMTLAESDLPKYREQMRPVLEVLLDKGLSENEEAVELEALKSWPKKNKCVGLALTHKQLNEVIPIISISPVIQSRGSVLWFDQQGKSHLFDKNGTVKQEIENLVGSGYSVIAADLFLTGEANHPDWKEGMPVDETYSGYTFGYNKTTIAQRVHDILTVVSKFKAAKELHVVGTGDAGLWALLAGTLMEDAADTMIVNLDGFSFADIKQTSDANFLPGALRFGDIGGLGLLATPKRLDMGGVAEKSKTAQLLKLGTPAQNGKLRIESENLSRKQIVELILKMQ